MKFSRELAIFFAFVFIWGVMFYPALLNIDSGFLGGIRGDVAIYIYLLKQNMARVITLPSSWYDGNFFYPFGNSLTFSDNFILPALIGKLIYLVTNNFALTWNVIMVLGPTTGGYITFCLSRYITGRSIVAFFCGISFMCLPFLYAHLGHPQLQFTFGIPAILLACFYFAESRRIFPASLIGLIVLAEFLTSVYYGVFVCLLALLTLLSYALIKHRTISARDLLVLILANIPWLFMSLIIVEPYLATRDTFSPWNIKLSEHLSANFYSYFSFSGKHLLWGKFSQGWIRNGSWLGLGLTLVIILASGFFKALTASLVPYSKTKSKHTYLRSLKILFGFIVFVLATTTILYQSNFSSRFYAQIVICSFWVLLILSFCMLILLSKNNIEKKLSPSEYSYILLFIAVFLLFTSLGLVNHTSGTALYYYIYHYLPGFDGLRAVYRIGVVASFILIIFAGLILKKEKNYIILIAICLIAIEYKTVSYKPTLDKQVPRLYLDLAKIDNNGAVLNLPFSSPIKDGLKYIRYHSSYMLWTSDTNRPIMNGWSGKLPLYYQLMGDKIDKFPDQSTLNILGQIVGLRYVVLHTPFKGKFKKKIFYRKVEEVADQVRVIKKQKRGSGIFEINPVVNLNDLKIPELYLKPDTKKSREINFELSANTVGSISIESSKKLIATINITKPNHWYKYSIKVPPSLHSIKPQRIIFKDLPKERVLLRNVRFANM